MNTTTLLKEKIAKDAYNKSKSYVIGYEKSRHFTIKQIVKGQIVSKQRRTTIKEICSILCIDKKGFQDWWKTEQKPLEPLDTLAAKELVNRIKKHIKNGGVRMCPTYYKSDSKAVNEYLNDFKDSSPLVNTMKLCKDQRLDYCNDIIKQLESKFIV